MQDFFNWQGLIGTIFGLTGIIFSWKAWKKSQEVERFLEQEKVRLSEKIEVVLTNGNEEIRLPEFRRQEFTRGEIQGRLGTIPMKERGSRYSIEYTNMPDYYEKINRIIEGSNETVPSVLEIKCTDAEFAQFALISKVSEPEKRASDIKPPQKVGQAKNV